MNSTSPAHFARMDWGRCRTRRRSDRCHHEVPALAGSPASARRIDRSRHSGVEFTTAAMSRSTIGAAFSGDMGCPTEPQARHRVPRGRVEFARARRTRMLPTSSASESCSAPSPCEASGRRRDARNQRSLAIAAPQLADDVASGTRRSTCGSLYDATFELGSGVLPTVERTGCRHSPPPIADRFHSSIRAMRAHAVRRRHRRLRRRRSRSRPRPSRGFCRAQQRMRTNVERQDGIRPAARIH